MFSPRIRTKSLAVVCRSLSNMLESGIAIQKAFTLAADKTGDARCSEAMRKVAKAVGQGDEVSEAMRGQGQTFPDLMIEMVNVAEQTGTLPEILKGLADHYENTVRMRRNFVAQITWPVVQFTAAVFVIAFLIWILGVLGS
ncbi:MAG: type II secretion system F family protein, partial [Planctomycetaceae bacterium]